MSPTTPVLATITPSLPLTHPVSIVALAVAIFLVAPLVFERLRVPGIVGLIVAGAVVGPHGLGLLARDATIVLLGTVGLLYLMFLAGTEIDLHGFRRHRHRSLLFGALTFTLPQTLGTGVGLLLGYDTVASVLLGSMFASHTLVAYPVASRLGIARSDAVTATVGGTIVTDTLALLVLAVIAASVRGSLDAAFWLRLSVSLVLLGVAVGVVLPRLGRWFFRFEGAGATSEYVFILLGLFGSAFLAELAGVEGILGAFLAGLALNRLVPKGGPLDNRLHFFGDAFFIPFFLLSVGMLVDVRVLTGSARVWVVMLAMVGTVTATKAAAAFLTARLVGFSRSEAWTVFGLSVPQAAATLAATMVGFELGLFDEAVLNGAILMILVTCVIGPWMVQHHGREVALQEEGSPWLPSDAPERILIPIANPATAPALLDLALALRDPAAEQPLYPLTVVPEEQDEPASARVAEAEQMLAKAVAYAAGAEVAAIPLTRVDRNFADGIVRGIADKGASTVIVGWDGREPKHRRVFGTVLDQLLERTRQTLVVAKLGHPLATTRRVVLVLPRGADHMTGFLASLRSVKGMARRLGAPVLALVVDGPADAYRTHLDTTRPDVPVTVEAVDGWDALLDALGARLASDDLVVVLGARHGTIAWQPELEQLPGQLARLVPESFLMIYPSEAAAVPEAMEAAAALARATDRRWVVVDLPAIPLTHAVGELLVRGGCSPERSATAARALLADLDAHAPSRASGVTVLDAHDPERDRPAVFVGVAPSGLSDGTTRVLVLVLGPRDGEPEQRLAHLRTLLELTRRLARPEQARHLGDQRTPDGVLAWLRGAAG